MSRSLSEPPLVTPATPGFLVPAAERVQTRQYRCQGRPLERKEPPLETMMERVERIAEAAKAAHARPVVIGLRACGSYRSLTLGDRRTSEKRLYDARGALVAILETSDQVDPRCGTTPDEATVHHGQHVDCMETELLYPPP